MAALVASGAGNGRGSRLVRTNVDQAPLDVAAEDVLSTTYTYRADHLLATATLPNASVVRQVWDDHGFLYKTIRAEGTLDLVPWRYFFDADG